MSVPDMEADENSLFSGEMPSNIIKGRAIGKVHRASSTATTIGDLLDDGIADGGMPTRGNDILQVADSDGFEFDKRWKSRATLSVQRKGGMQTARLSLS